MTPDQARARRALVAQAKTRRMKSAEARRQHGPRLPSDLAYRADLRAIVRTTWDMILEEEFRRADAEGLTFRLFDVVQAKVPGAASKQGKRVSEKGAEDSRRVLGIDPRAEAGVAPVLDSFVIENVRLITSVAEEQHERVRQTLKDNFGLRHEELADKLEEQFKITRNRAELIARDQTLKLAGDLTHIRQTSAGIDSYIWTTSGDTRVREEHDALEGEVFTWAAGHPTEGHPGQAILCRCTPYPIVPGFEDEG